MKAKLVKEVQSFKRGSNPHKKLGVGKYYKPFTYIESVNISVQEYNKSHAGYSDSEQISKDNNIWEELYDIKIKEVFDYQQLEILPYTVIESGYENTEEYNNEDGDRVYGFVEVEILRENYDVFRDAIKKFNVMNDNELMVVYNMPAELEK